MSRLLLFVPCRQILLDKDDLSLSMISVLHGLILQPLTDSSDAIPAKAVAPMEWGVATFWLRVPEDEGKAFEQKIEVVLPDGTNFFGEQATVLFKMTHRTHSIRINAKGFPMGVVGEYRIVLYLREIGQEEWQMVTDYPIEISHAKRDEPSGEQPSQAE